jgi:hypothetical protein
MYSDVLLAQRYTLVVGAGINAGRNVPDWNTLVRKAWDVVFGAEGDSMRQRAQRLAEARTALQTHCGWTAREAARLDLPIHPLEPQLALELIDLHIQDNSDAAQRARDFVAELPGAADRRSSELLALLLVRCLYEGVRRDGSADTLSELARFIGASRRLVRIISFNVDNLLELEVELGSDGKQPGRAVEVISRQRHRPLGGIPSYHLHGYLPINLFGKVPDWAGDPHERRPRMKTAQLREHHVEAVPEALVFTDAQYWQSVATPLSFANFVFANALHDSSCLFIGVSMTDLNTMRWLGLHSIEFRREYEREIARMNIGASTIPSPYIRHCWIRPDADDPSSLLTSFLGRRGVYPYVLPRWGAEHVRNAFDELLAADV